MLYKNIAVAVVKVALFCTNSTSTDSGSSFCGGCRIVSESRMRGFWQPHSGGRIQPGGVSAPGTGPTYPTSSPRGQGCEGFESRKQEQVPLGTKDSSPPIYRWDNRDDESGSPVRDDRGSRVVSMSILFFQDLPSLTGLFGLNRYDNPPINRWAIVGSPYRDKMRHSVAQRGGRFHLDVVDNGFTPQFTSSSRTDPPAINR